MSDDPAKSLKFLTVPKAASLAGYSKRHFRRLAEAAGLPIKQFGRKHYILRTDFDVWVKREKG